jgi:hypothetical protein
MDGALPGTAKPKVVSLLSYLYNLCYLEFNYLESKLKEQHCE